MARGRMLSKSLSTSQRFAGLAEVAGKLAEFCQSLYPLINSHADDFGRLQGDPFTVKHVCHPTSPRRVAEFGVALQFLDDVGLIRWYEVDGQSFIQIVKFDQHQIGLAKRTKSRFPACPARNVEVPGTSMKVPDIPSELELKRTQEKRTELEQSAATSATPTAVLTFPTIGQPESWDLTVVQAGEWQEQYPVLDVLAECRKAQAWVKANQPKTAGGMPKFLVRWLNSAVDRTPRAYDSRAPATGGKGAAVVEGVQRGLARYAARKAQEGR